MKKIVIGILLIILGGFLLAYGRITFTKKEKVFGGIGLEVVDMHLKIAMQTL